MSAALARLLAAAVCGLLFGAGLVLGGMTRPEAVLAFLDVLGRWNPSLLFVMAGAVGVHAVGYRLVRRRERPLAAEHFRVPDASPIDARLLGGAALFGAGWGLSGFCPGPLVVSLAAGAAPTLAFAFFTVLGVVLVNAIDARRPAAALDPQR